MTTERQEDTIRIVEVGTPHEVAVFLDTFGRIDEICSEETGHTVLHLAVLSGDCEKVQIVLDRKPNLEIHSRNKRFTPLHTATINDYGAVMELLIDAGANVEATAHSDLRALHLAAMRGHASATTVLLRRGADVQATELNDATALHAAAHRGFVEVARALTQYRADPDRADRNGLTPWALAIHKGHAGILELFLGELSVNGGPIVSGSQQEHFSKIVTAMNAIGANRSGSRAIVRATGDRIIVDIYTLPNGKTFLAGYVA